MLQPRVLILRAPGTNCDQETAFAFQQAGGGVDAVHVNALLEQPQRLAGYQILCLPGGFSYGDDLAAGRILATRIRHRLAGAVQEFKAAGKLILGICNGFQILIKSGALLDAADDGGSAATLAHNVSGKFEDRWVWLDVNPGPCVFLRGITRMYLPVAHGEGQFLTRDRQTLDRLRAAGQLALRYGRAESAAGNGGVPYPENPNGSLADVAGVCDATGRVFGLMPHPERHIDRTQHPRWTREDRPPEGDGLAVFRNAVRLFA